MPLILFLTLLMTVFLTVGTTSFAPAEAQRAPTPHPTVVAAVEAGTSVPIRTAPFGLAPSEVLAVRIEDPSNVHVTEFVGDRDASGRIHLAFGLADDAPATIRSLRIERRYGSDVVAPVGTIAVRPRPPVSGGVSLRERETRIGPGPVPTFATLLVNVLDVPVRIEALHVAPPSLGPMRVPVLFSPRADEDAVAAFQAWTDAALAAMASVPSLHDADASERLRRRLLPVTGPEADWWGPGRPPLEIPPGGSIGILVTAASFPGWHAGVEVVFDPAVDVVGAGDDQVRRQALFGPVRWPSVP